MVRVIKKVWVNKSNKQKLITIPKDCDIKEGDYVIITLLEDNKSKGERYEIQ
jgi:hypothetical protein